MLSESEGAQRRRAKSKRPEDPFCSMLFQGVPLRRCPYARFLCPSARPDLPAEIHSINAVFLGEAIDEARFGLTNALGEQSGHADVEDCAVPMM